jgi:hypothetical protein
MRKNTKTTALILTITLGLVLASTISLHSSSPVYAQTNATKKSTAGNSTAQQQAGGGAKKAGGSVTNGAKPSATPPTTTATVKGGPKAAGTASQLNQIEGNNTQILSKNTNIANKPGLAALPSENNATGK